MIVVADESVDYGLVIRLREHDISVVSVLEGCPGVLDEQVIDIANQHQCLLLTEDKDFGELSYRLKFVHHGILLIRLNDISRLDRIEKALKTITEHYEKLMQSFLVLTSRGLRIKPTQKTNK
jgi:predicted nuclease of predicted toxin-antitoxin system